MTSVDPSHVPHLAAREKHTGNPATAHARPHSGSGSGSAKHVAVIPDLRFERSYLKSITPYVRTRRVAGSVDGRGEAREIVDIEWKKVFWITARDQLISPLLQGSLWGVAQLFVRPLVANIRAFFGFSRRTPSTETQENTAKPKGEGELTRRLREWSKTLKEG
ncbi:hypothetical protein ACEPAF_1418 [Sanghuangporus sanghuang]